MAIRVQAQGQTFEFEDGTTEAQIGEALDSHFGGQSQPVQQQPQQINPQGLTAEQLNRLEEMQNQVALEQAEFAKGPQVGAVEAGLIGVGKGMTDVGQFFKGAVGAGETPEQRAERDAIQSQLVQRAPIAGRVGEFIGETVATAPLGGLAGSIGKSLLTGVTTRLGAQAGGRFATGAGLVGGGAAEGAAVATQLGEDATTGAAIGAGANLLMPAVFRAGKNAFQKLTGKTATGEIFDEATGELTEAATKELQDAGIPLEQFAGEVQTLVSQNFDPAVDLAAQARQAQLQEFAPEAVARPSRLAQDFPAQSAEEQLIALGTPEGRNLLQAEQAMQEQLAQGVQTKILGELDTDLISRFNSVSDDANKGLLGDSAKLAINEIRDESKAKVDDLYSAARELAGDGQQVFSGNVLSVFKSGANELNPSDGLINATGRALKEFNVIEEGSDLADSFSFKAPVELKDLTLDNAEKLRQRLNKLDPRDGSQDSLFIGQIRQQLDNEVDSLIDTFPEEAAVAKAFKDARQASAAYNQTFSDKELVSKLVDFKRGTKDIDQIPSEKVLDVLMRSDLKSVQKVKSLMLEKSTENSRKAWNEMKFTVIDEVLRDSMNKQTGEISGQRFNTALSKIGDERLKLLLGNEKFNQLKRFQTVLSDQTIPLRRLENPSGTSGPVINMLGALGDLIKGSADASTGGLVSAASKNSAQRKAIEGALNDIQTATGRSGRVKRLKAQQKIAEFFKELAVIGTVSAGGQEQP